jgi:phosphoribosylformylglycinamidine synthase
MLEGPIGAAAFNNEFGRPNIAATSARSSSGRRRSGGELVRGYHKPIMIAGGLGNIREAHVEKAPTPPGAPIVVLGGPAMLIGLGGGAASSVGQRRLATRTSTSPRCSAATPRCSGAARR